jgi:PhnB protein
MAVNPVPDGYHTVTPFLYVRGVAGLIEFMRRVFDARELERMEGPDGSIRHAEMRIGDSVVMLGEATGDNPPRPGMLHLYLEDADVIYGRVLEAGASSLQEPRDEFWGDRISGVQDPSWQPVVAGNARRGCHPRRDAAKV